MERVSLISAPEGCVVHEIQSWVTGKGGGCVFIYTKILHLPAVKLSKVLSVCVGGEESISCDSH